MSSCRRAARASGLGSGSGVIAIRGGNEHPLALKADGSVVASVDVVDEMAAGRTGVGRTLHGHGASRWLAASAASKRRVPPLTLTSRRIQLLVEPQARAGEQPIDDAVRRIWPTRSASWA
jgi:hypothetical protein